MKRNALSNFFIMLFTLMLNNVNAFVAQQPFKQQKLSSFGARSSNSMNMIPAELVHSSSMLVAETEAWVAPTAAILGPILNLLSFAMVRRTSFELIPNSQKYNSYAE